jgi:hypothetical protein
VIHTGTASGGVSTVTAAHQTQINAAATLVLAAGIAAGDIAFGTNNIGTFTYQGDTYLLQNNVAATFDDTDDLLIRVTGATGTLSTANVVV